MANNTTLSVGDLYLSAQVYTAEQLEKFAASALTQLEEAQEPYDMISVLSGYFTNFIVSRN